MRQISLVALFVAVATVVLAGPLPSRVKLGGLFPQIGKTGSFDGSGLQRKAAFELALKLINDDATILDGVVLEAAFRDSQRDAGSAFFGALELCDTEEATAIVGAASSGPSKNAALVTKEFNAPQISYSATSSALSDKATYPTFLRTVPPDGYQALGLAWLGLNQYGWKRIGIIYDSSGYGTDGAQDFQNAAKQLGIEVISPQVFNAGETVENIKIQLQTLKGNEAKIIVLFSNAANAGKVFTAAKDLDMVGPATGFQWLVSDGVMRPETWTGEFAPIAPLLQGMIGLKPRIDSTNAKYISMITAWDARQAGTDYPNVAWQRTSFDGTSYVADANSRILYNAGGDKNAGTLVQYDSTNEGTINSYAPYSFDAVYAIAYALDSLFTTRAAEIQALTDTNGDFATLENRKAFSALVLDELAKVDFEGVTGKVAFNENFDRLMGYDLYNLVGTTEVKIAQWDPFQFYHSQVQAITWPDGSTGDDNAPQDRDPCPPGKYEDTTTKACIECQPGFFKATVGPAACTKCGAGEYQDASGQSACKACEAGTYRPEGAQYTSTTCLKCEPDEYQEASGQQSCSSCPAGTSNFLPGVLAERANDQGLGTAIDAFFTNDKSYCTCRVGYYGIGGANTCKACPDGGVCCTEGSGAFANQCISGSEKPNPAPGYFRSQNDEYTMVECQIAEACLGGADSECAAGYFGNRCGQCASEGYYRLGQFCRKCPDGASALLVLVVILLVVLIGVMLYISAIGIRLSSMIIFTNVVQVTALYAYYNLNWPRLLLDIMDLASFLNFNLELFAPECYFGSGAGAYYSKWAVWLLLPIVFALLLAGTYGAFSLLGNSLYRNHSREKISPWHSLFIASRQERINKFINAYVMFLGVAYTLLCSKSLELFICKPKADGTYALRAAPDLDCYTSEYYSMIPVAVISLLVYGIGLPVALAVLLRRNRHRLNDTEFRMRYGSVFKGYKEEWYMWDVAAMLRKFGILFGTVVFSGTTMYQTLFGLLVLFAYLLLEVHARPFKIKAVNRVQVVADITLFITLLSGVFFDSGKLNDGWEGATDFISYALLVIIIFAFAVALVTVVLEARIHWRALKYSTNSFDEKNASKTIA